MHVQNVTYAMVWYTFVVVLIFEKHDMSVMIYIESPLLIYSYIFYDELLTDIDTILKSLKHRNLMKNSEIFSKMNTS